MERPLLYKSELQSSYNCVICKRLLRVPYQSICGCRADYDCVKETVKGLKLVEFDIYIYR